MPFPRFSAALWTCFSTSRFACSRRIGSTVNRFHDYWKTEESLELAAPTADIPGESSECESPIADRYRGIPVWIHPRDGGLLDCELTSDGGHTFLLDDAIANVQLERYVPKEGSAARKTEILKKIYYLAKPLMPRFLQLTAQRVNARSRLRKVEYPEWPQDDSLRGFLNAALVDLIERANTDRVPFIGFWPRGYSWAACFTHDVEMPPGLRGMGKMANIEKENGIRSTWYLVPERYPVSREDFDWLRDDGHEIGVQGLKHDGKLFATREEFTRRVPLVNRYLREWEAVGFRSPVLYRNPDWLPELEISYDSSFMDSAVLEPQMGGVSTCLPFHLNDQVIELPITMPMDHHLINLLKTDLVEGMLTKFQWVVERHGMANFLYHPDYNLGEDMLKAYRKVVESVVQTQGGWVTTAADIADWWKRRHESKIVSGPEGPSVEGPASADGAIWIARLDEGKVVIEEPL